MKNIFFYDGDCPFCVKLANHLKNYLTNSKIEIVSFRNFSENELKNIHPTLTIRVLQGNTQLIYNGIRYPHFFGIRKLMHHLKYYKFLAPLLYLPFVPILGILGMYILKKFTKH